MSDLISRADAIELFEKYKPRMAVEQTAHYCNKYAVFCTGANERGECNTTACWNSQWLHELLRRGW